MVVAWRGIGVASIWGTLVAAVGFGSRGAPGGRGVLFASVELEAVIACHAVGLDPGLGFLHLDRPRRASLACDLMEPIRSAAVVQLVRMLASRPLSLRDVVERPDGEVRCRAGLFRELWAHSPAWGRAVAPLAEQVAGRLMAAIPAREGGLPLEAATPLTGRRRRAAQAGRRGWVEPSRGEPRRPAELPRACLGCGGAVEGSRKRCSSCASERRRELRDELRAARVGRPRGGVAGGAAELREPAASVRAGLGRLAAAVGLPGWEAALELIRELGPELGGLTGASAETVGRWRRGEAAPSEKWWPALRELRGVELVAVPPAGEPSTGPDRGGAGRPVAAA